MLEGLGFEYVLTLNGYYHKASMRSDVVEHLNLFAPLLFNLMDNPQEFYLCFGDCSGIPANLREQYAWSSRTDPNGRYDNFTMVGQGVRYSYYSFLTIDGTLRDSRGVIDKRKLSDTFTSNDFLPLFHRACAQLEKLAGTNL